MTDYTHLSMRDRCLIATFLSMETKIKTIAIRSGRHRSTIYREISRNKNGIRYMPGIAHEMAKLRHPHQANKIDTNLKLNLYVLKGLQDGWSPERAPQVRKVEMLNFLLCEKL